MSVWLISAGGTLRSALAVLVLAVASVGSAVPVAAATVADGSEADGKDPKPKCDAHGDCKKPTSFAVRYPGI